ncbi:phage adaptor protein [Pelagerythrobacter marinus]|uniref:phage adaptor protein n=1 Tax=Pelagerythrobacter marinus TaxID=538382 RepID=UPI002AC90FFA|nr:hypothetical protein [Pelagerythrobacter marinus]WPZ05492.1 hypothetical protein T8T98_08605 [Pelagerythrobacter marinus]
MTIAVSTSPANSISNLSDLVAEIRDEMDDDAYPLDKINRAIGRAEAVFNRELRCPRMETEYVFTTSQEETDLPLDFLQLRSVYAEGSPDNPLTSMSPNGLRQLYRGISGVPMACAIENRRLVIAPVGETTLTILYYARIPALTDSNPTNWLLDEHPDVYLHQVLSILFNKTGDSERAALNLDIATSLLTQINDSGKKNRWGAGPLTPLGVTQVCGARI